MWLNIFIINVVFYNEYGTTMEQYLTKWFLLDYDVVEPI